MLETFGLVLFLVIIGAFFTEPKFAFGCLFCCLLLLAVILGFFAHNVSDWLVTTCRIIVYSTLSLIVIGCLMVKIDEMKKEKKEAEERDRLEREKRERFATLKKELIESGLFYEDDPWDKLPDADNYRG